MMTTKEARKHPSSPRSIGAYLATKTLDSQDRELIASVTAPKGWIDKFENIENLNEEEMSIREKILSGIKKYPPLKVTSRFFNYTFQLHVSQNNSKRISASL